MPTDFFPMNLKEVDGEDYVSVNELLLFFHSIIQYTGQDFVNLKKIIKSLEKIQGKCNGDNGNHQGTLNIVKHDGVIRAYPSKSSEPCEILNKHRRAEAKGEGDGE